MDIIDFFKNDRFARNAGIEIVEVRKGYAKVKMEVSEMHLNGGNVVQGGALFTLADLAFAVAVNSHGRLTFSIQSNINIFKSERVGSILYAEAKEVFNHPKICNCEVNITNAQGELVATFSGSGFRKEIPLPFEPLTE
ncbi:MAG: hotdog fold thioesterase [Candidatus Azobacteroides sp.]|nr:hotdog fold thioesterase [Candidatus Azobacteroides sp.]